ncbi:hypothetical protein AAHV66_09165 [Klebsiella pneumoniae]|uniref:hypothetical protein n=1 Tax=Klebsiella pneumoniae TaxID=573 RepID=UPI001D17D5A5|nr:hypothetical protein [Klebsiella pneumoniae]HBX3741369.1 hypothetical protein [Klebsiella pneumoniae subsp. pneumoniae]MBQ5132814.1 hypothetical protein [Klebsiella pneumoniae]HBY6093276.1 hypothetical protein [Klebsiella pneumoniae]HBY7313648.1 hypothetical protein [Klebsiella pneumoniae]HBY8473873.1 hypothetical protein [Klebsiella pneumoniae]
MGIASSYKRIHFLEGVIMVVLTERVFRFSLFISQLLAKAIPVRGAKFKKACFLAGFLLFSAGTSAGRRMATLRRLRL